MTNGTKHAFVFNQMLANLMVWPIGRWAFVRTKVGMVFCQSKAGKHHCKLLGEATKI
jgi:hypothetical protein